MNDGNSHHFKKKSEGEREREKDKEIINQSIIIDDYCYLIYLIKIDRSIDRSISGSSKKFDYPNKFDLPQKII